MMTRDGPILLVVAAVVDAILIGLLILVAPTFVLSATGVLRIICWLVALGVCIAAPMLGFSLLRRGREGFGAVAAWMPPITALVIFLAVRH
jgi:hypothetical protein